MKNRYVTLRSSASYKNALERYPWIIQCLERDNYQCTDCRGSKNLVVHHIDESRRTGNMNNNLENLITLCRVCHTRAHGQLKPELFSQVYFLRENCKLTFREIGEALGMSKQRAHMIYQRNLMLDNH